MPLYPYAPIDEQPHEHNEKRANHVRADPPCTKLNLNSESPGLWQFQSFFGFETFFLFHRLNGMVTLVF